MMLGVSETTSAPALQMDVVSALGLRVTHGPPLA
jgi:hypothetical protein